MSMPVFQRTKKNVDWAEGELITSKLISSFWEAASEKEKNDARFLILLVKCSRWNGENSKFNHRLIAEYLGLDWNNSVNILAKEVNDHWPKIDVTKAKELLSSNIGITNAYPSHRPIIEKFVRDNSKKIRNIFDIVSSKEIISEEKIKKVMGILDSLPLLSAYGKKFSLINGISPVIACLDSDKKFPIMNNRTKELLVAMGREQNLDGAVSLSNLISPKYDIKNSFELDVYAQTESNNFPKLRKSRNLLNKLGKKTFRDVGYQSEESSYADIAEKKIEITKNHIMLINKFKKAFEWEYKLEESCFDILISDWHGKKVLIEAKTSSSGTAGRSQVRQAIGQLFDYRKTYFEKEIDKIILVLLLAEKPSQDIMDLMKSLKIEVIWLSKDKVEGTIDLCKPIK